MKTITMEFPDSVHGERLGEAEVQLAILRNLILLNDRMDRMGTNQDAIKADLDAIKAGLADVPNRITAVVAAAVAAAQAGDDAALADAKAEADEIAASVAGLAQPAT